MSSNTQTTLLEKLSLIPLLGQTVAWIFIRSITAPFRNGQKANKPLKDILFAGLRFLSENITAAQEAWTNRNNSTEKEYLAFAKKTQMEPVIIGLDSGLKLCWVGPKDAKNIMLYLHGGGFVGAASPGHLQWAAELQKTCSKDTSFSVVFAAYTLTTPTGGRYPVQLREAADALHWLIEKHGKKPSEIILGGDSAGGNLCLALLSHMLHPHPEAIKIDLEEPLQSAVLISPWVSFDIEDSYRRNAHSDFLTPKSLQRWSSMYKHTSVPDNFNEPIRADEQWFSGLDNIVKDILILAGGAEVFVDSIQKFTKTVQSVHPRAELVVQNGASHVDLIIEMLLGYGKGKDAVLIEEWISERIMSLQR